MAFASRAALLRSDRRPFAQCIYRAALGPTTSSLSDMHLCRIIGRANALPAIPLRLCLLAYIKNAWHAQLECMMRIYVWASASIQIYGARDAFDDAYVRTCTTLSVSLCAPPRIFLWQSVCADGAWVQP